MEYQKIINIWDNTPNQPSKFRPRNWVEINAEPRGTHNANRDIRFTTSMIRSNFCDYSDGYIHVKATIAAPNTAAAVNNPNKKVIFKNCSPFNNWISEINNTQIDDTQDIDYAYVMPMYNSIEDSDIYSKASRQYYWMFKAIL